MPRRFQFSLRALLVAMALMSLPLWWVANNARFVRHRREFMMEDNGLILYICGHDKSISWIRRALGDRAMQRICYDPDSRPTSEALSRSRALFPESQLVPIDLLIGQN